MKTTHFDTRADSPVIARLLTVLSGVPGAPAEDSPTLVHGVEVARIVDGLEADELLVTGALLHPLLAEQSISEAAAQRAFGGEAVRFAGHLASLGGLQLSGQWNPERPLSAGQAETLRKMLLAVVTDPRLVLVRLAVQLHAMRCARELAPEQRLRLAWETREVYAPLANRLGIWQLKWELEDLAFRYLDAEAYRKIAAQLNERRADREQYIVQVKSEVAAELAKVGVEADIAGRPKHIYSIWRKMDRKNLAFDQVFDIRAIRVIAATVADCYAALGAIHGRWPYIPGEFDDYIATPKDNLYRSLHTAVIGPGGMPLEVQIRTREMHDHAELGVAAHWRYKEGRAQDAAYDRKIEWLREVLSPAGDAESEGDFLDRVRADLFEDRVYALTPRGEVVDLPSGATPLDFAYHVHTELGHRCRGARVNGRIVPLEFQLSNGEVVEIIDGKVSQPSRDWLVEQQGYLASPRSRAKVRAWFKRQDEGQNRQEGRGLFEAEMARLGLHDSFNLPELLQDLGLERGEDLYLALGAGDLTFSQVAGAIQRRIRERAPPPQKVAPVSRDAAKVRSSEVQGIGDLLSTYARCCRPVPPEPITGYVTIGRGVTIHRLTCPNLKRLALRAPERLLEVGWSGEENARFPVSVQIHALDRRGLVRDISALLADEKVSIEQMLTQTDAGDGTADISLRISVSGLQELSRLLARITGLANVVSARRSH